MSVTLQAETAKPRTSRLKLYIFLFAAGVIAAVLGAGGFLLFQSRTVDHYFVLGNNEYDKALGNLDVALDRLSRIKVGKNGKDVARQAKLVRAPVPAARLRLKRAAGAFKRMERAAFTPWERQTASLLYKSAVEARKGTDDLKAGLRDLETVINMFAKVKLAAGNFNDAFGRANEAITAGNEDRFAEARQKAGEADKGFGAAQDLLGEAVEMMPDGDIASLVPSISKARQWATGVDKMAAAGEAKQVAVYNQLAKENNQLSDEVAGIGRSPVLADPRGWFSARLTRLNERVGGHFDRADKLREKALRLWRANT